MICYHYLPFDFWYNMAIIYRFWSLRSYTIYTPRRIQLGRKYTFATKSQSYRFERKIINQKIMSDHLSFDSGWVWRTCIPPAGSSEGYRFRIFHFGQIKRPNLNFLTIYFNMFQAELGIQVQELRTLNPFRRDIYCTFLNYLVFAI